MDKDKTIRDEQTLAKVLEAAYVLQEHNCERRNRKADPKLTEDQLIAEQLIAEHRADSSPGGPQPQAARPTAATTTTLAQIVEIQHQVQVQRLGIENVMSLVTERLSQLAGAGGAAICILDGKKVQYRAAYGVMALPPGTEVPLEKALCVDCLRTGEALRWDDVNSDVALNQDERRLRGIRAMLAVPVFHDGVVFGSLELYFSETRTFTDEDVHTCQLMAGLVSEALARNEKASWKTSLATERAVMLEALEKLKPNLAVLADKPDAKDFAGIARASFRAGAGSTFCRACGHELAGQEQFCGNCGSPRGSVYEAPKIQSAIEPWHKQAGLEKTPQPLPWNGLVMPTDSRENPAQVDIGDEFPDSVEDQLPEPLSAPEPRRPSTPESMELQPSADFEGLSHADLEIPVHTMPEDDIQAPQPTALVKAERSATWSSAATALGFFRKLSMGKDRGAWVDLLKRRRGDIYVAIAVVLFLAAVRWGMWSKHSVSATGNPTVSARNRRAAPDADLSLFDRILVKLGLAEAPDLPEYKGNPATQVWVDLETALYYCPGADLYGKTPKGRFSSQRAARLDQFEPAYHKACD